MKLTVQKDVLNGVKLQQVFAVEFLLQNQQCDTCQRSYTDHTWRAQVQVRQKVEHKKTFYLLEQLILKHNAHAKCIGVEQVPTGIDFNFAERSHALKFIDFISSVVPTRETNAKQLISEDIHLSLKRYKFTFSIEIVPLCKDDLVVLPRSIAGGLGNIDPVCLVLRVSSNVFVMDPRTLQIAELNAERYWREPFRYLMNSSSLEEFTVLDVTPVTVAPTSNAVAQRRQEQLIQKKNKKMNKNSDARDRNYEISRIGNMSSTASVRSGLGNLGGTHSDDSISPRVAGTKRSSGTMKSGMDDDDVSVAAESGMMNGSFAGGFTGAVSLAGGSVHFGGGMSVASTVTGGPKGKLLLADAEVMRTRDLGVSNTSYIVRTHLGNILRSGDIVMGYDLTNAVYNDADADGMGLGTTAGGRGKNKGSTAGREVVLPDIVLVRKVLPKFHQRRNDDDNAQIPSNTDHSMNSGSNNNETNTNEEDISMSRNKPKAPRVWKLKRLEDTGLPVSHHDTIKRSDEEKAAKDYEAFLQELESDPLLRKGINLYKDHAVLEQRRAAIALSGNPVTSSPSSSVSLSSATATSLSSETKTKSSTVYKGLLGKTSKSATSTVNKGPKGVDPSYGDEDYGEIGLEELLDDMNIQEEENENDDDDNDDDEHADDDELENDATTTGNNTTNDQSSSSSVNGLVNPSKNSFAHIGKSTGKVSKKWGGSEAVEEDNDHGTATSATTNSTGLSSSVAKKSILKSSSTPSTASTKNPSDTNAHVSKGVTISTKKNKQIAPKEEEEDDADI